MNFLMSFTEMMRFPLYFVTTQLKLFTQRRTGAPYGIYLVVFVGFIMIQEQTLYL